MTVILAYAPATPAAPAAPAAPARPSPGLRVLHVFRYFRPDFTGEGLYLEKIAPILADMGVHSDVVAAATTPQGRHQDLPAIGSVRLFGDGGRHRRGLRLHLLCHVLRHVHAYDVVHFHSPIDRLFLAHLIARAAGCRVVQSCTLGDGLGAVVATYHPRWRRPIARLARVIHDMVAISPALRDDSLSVLPPGRVHLVPQGVVLPTGAPVGSTAALRAAFDLAEDDLVLLYVGGLERRKDVGFLIRTLPPCSADGRRVRLLVVGPDLDAAYRRELDEAAAAHPPGTVLFAGYMENPAPAYRMADAFVFASLQEGFGNVLLEAMAAGLPVLSRRLPGVTDSFIRDGQTGFLFDDEAGYRATLDDLAGNPALRQRIGSAAAQAVRCDFDIRAMAARYRDIYRGTA